ncbi:dUTP diphosphatase [Rhodohalobacter sp. 8-1]|uniref:dUTP diphosphatase n=1 Tax=Rhodohalobacter sp. 8-1 TaxID=3131972 RepID=UPI0030EDF0C3
MKKPICEFKKLSHAADLPLPSYESDYAAGMDLRAAVPGTVPIKPGERALIPTGLQMGLQDGFEAQIRPRSGLAFKFGITMLNAPGTIDSDYRGEIKVLVINHGDEVFNVSFGDRIAQMIIAPVSRAEIREVQELGETERNKGGFGSTGIE